MSEPRKFGIILRGGEYREDHTYDTTEIINVIPGETVEALVNRLLPPKKQSSYNNPFTDHIELRLELQVESEGE